MAKTKIKVKELRDYLNTLDNKEMINELVDLFKTFPDVKEYYLARLKPEYLEEVLEDYRKVIIDEFFPARGDGKLRYSVMKKAISDFKKISDKADYIAELMLTYVEQGVKFTNTYGDISERFYINIEKMFESTLDYIIKNDLEKQFRKRCKKAMDNSSGIGWGFADSMMDIYYTYFSE
ncbi:hypothetical protein BX659_11464 [Orenia metallireducens]|jgi:hypothetical protein|uniref:Uncharacterized protein n=1 Tax=Orenia metallireducens TaxID=1413210 RepID=A0A285IBM6_9FIRM|nr:DUF6155 family protein [Orenia metallireducens]PRX28014.1 hypothetical protein BX659_11464 [Orenia metallireducens]SNY45404.1 hypothetical protein SAMN06265827_1385 [Orenia metallireducens]